VGASLLAMLLEEEKLMRVWIDADACPRAAKDLVVKFALKRQFEVVLVAGQPQIKPGLTLVKLIVVPSGPDAADDYLVEHAGWGAGDLQRCAAGRPPGEEGRGGAGPARQGVRRAEHG
jgi:hypothetical protein